MRSRLAELRREIQRFQRPDRPRAARYPRELRREIGRLALEAHASGTSFAAFVRSLGVAPTVVLRARQPDGRRSQRGPSAVRPVVVTPAAAPPAKPAGVVTLRCGTRVEGLSVPEIVVLIRALA